MAKRDVYRFSIEANNKEAKKSFEELKALAQDVEESSGKLKIDPRGEGNLTKTVKSMTEMLNTYTELSKKMDEEQTITFNMKGGKEALDQIKKTRMEIERETNRIQNNYNRTMRQYEAQTGKKAVLPINHNQNQDRISDTKQQAIDFAEQSRAIRNRARSTERIGSSAIGTKFINHAQATAYQQNTKDLLGMSHQGGTPEQVRDLVNRKVEFKPREGSVRGQAMDEMEKARRGREERQATIETVKKDDNIKDPLQREAVINKNTQEIEDLTEVIKNAQSVIKELDDAFVSVSANNKEVDSADIRQKEDRSTAKGRMYERASSIGMAMTGAGVYSVASAYSQGKGTVKDMRPQSLDVGYATGNNDYRGIRQDLMGQGAEYGFEGKEMLDFAQSILGSAGFKDDESLNKMTQNQMEFAKFSGAGTESSNEYLEDMFRSGAISTADQAKSIQEGFLGAIKMSGMEGREKEQIEALTTINDTLFRSREADEGVASNRQAMSAILSATGNKGLQGENLANLIGNADTAIQEASPFSAIGMSLGVGSDPTMSSYDIVKQKEQGFSGDNVTKLLDGFLARGYSDDNNEQSAVLMNDTLGLGNVDGAKEILDAYSKGDLSEDKIQEMANNLKNSSEQDDRKEGYESSSDQTREQLDSYTDKMKSLLDDNKLVDGLSSVANSVAKVGSKTAMGAMLLTGAIGAFKSLSVGIGSLASTTIGTKLTGLVSKGFSSVATKAGTGGFAGFAGNVAKGGLGVVDKAKGLFGTGAKEAVKTGAGAVDDVVGATVEGATKASTATSMGSNLLKGTEGMSKMATATNAGKQALSSMGSKIPYLQLAMSGVQIAMADDKKRETTKQAGGLTGMMAGTVAGASIGSVIPGVGTAIGGFVGGTAGYMGGLGIGDWWHSKTEDMFGGKDKKKKGKSKDPKPKVKGAYDEKEELATDQQDQANENNKYTVEKLREANIITETDNLAVANDLLARIERALETAKAQNGIVGDTSGLNSGSGGGGGVGGELSYTGNEEYWTNKDITKHDLGKTSDTLTAQQLDDWIDANTKGKDSVMKGMGSAFMEAGKETGLDPRYLVAHSAQETGWGTSQIAKDKNNMFGIGAFDDSPYSSAYGYGSTKEGIMNGAKFIAKDYYKEGQTTLDSMRNNGGKHEYATDPGWATKIGSIMKGSEGYTKPSNVNVTTNVNLASTGNTLKDGKSIASEVNKYLDYSQLIGTNYTQERKRI